MNSSASPLNYGLWTSSVLTYLLGGEGMVVYPAWTRTRPDIC